MQAACEGSLRQRAMFLVGRVRVYAVLGLLTLCAACAPSSYEGNFFIAGPQSRALGEDKFEIIASADTFADESIVEEYGLLKAAQTTVEFNKDVFRILSANLEQLNPNRGHSRLGLGYRITMVIETALERDIEGEAEDYYSAHELIETLAPKVGS